MNHPYPFVGTSMLCALWVMPCTQHCDRARATASTRLGWLTRSWNSVSKDRLNFSQGWPSMPKCWRMDGNA